MSLRQRLSTRLTGDDEGTFRDINVTPFVDVMLVLLVIFMITAPLLTSGVDIHLPRTQAGPIAESSEPLVISLDDQGHVFLQDRKLDSGTLLPKLRAITASNTQTRIFVRADRALSYGRVMTLMGKLQSAGYDRVALVTIFEEAAPLAKSGK